MGHADATSESGGGSGTVKMGRYEVAEMGGWMRVRAGGPPDFKADLSVGDDGCCCCFSVEAAVAAAAAAAAFRFSEGGVIPAATGAGRSRTSVALRASWREKSLACHHSRNLRAKIEAGRK